MSNRIFQGLVHQMRDAVGRTLGVIDETGFRLFNGKTPLSEEKMTSDL